MDDDLEEGEISGGSEPEPAEDELLGHYKILQRPPTLLAAAAGSSRTAGVDSRYQSKGDEKKAAEEDARFDKSSSSSDDDSDEDGPSGPKAKRMGMTGFGGQSGPSSSSGFAITPSSLSVNPTFAPNFTDAGGSSGTPMSSWSRWTAEGGGAVSDVFKSQAALFQSNRKPNEIWTKVLQDEQVSDVMGKFNVEVYDDKHVLIDRGPETFSVKYKNRPRVKQRSDSSSLSSGGLTDEELDYLRGTSHREDAPSSMQLVAEGGEEEGIKQFGRQPIKRTYNAKLRRERHKRKSKLRTKLRKMNAKLLSQYIASKLDEPKYNLILNTIEVLGKEVCISLFLKTTKIERRGGLMIMNNQRRRTPGGVFLYLLRFDTRYPKSAVDKIFEIDKQLENNALKRARKKKRRKNATKLEDKLEEYAREMEMKMKEGNNGSKVEDDQDQDIDPEACEDEELISDQDGDSEDVDSDEFCGTTGYPLMEEDADCLDIDCDPSDLS